MDNDKATRQIKDDEALVKAFVRVAYYALRAENDEVRAHFFLHATDSELRTLRELNGEVRDESFRFREKDDRKDFLEAAEIYAAIAVRARQEEWLKKQLPMQTRSAAFSQRMLDQGASDFAMLCCPIKFDL